MKWLKLSVLLILTVAAMRAGSWAVAWAAVRMVTAKVRMVAVGANLAGLAAFALLLSANSDPGEPVDWAAILFGLVVFAIFTVSDLVWRPWEPRVQIKTEG